MNNFRSTILSGAKLGIASPLVTTKKKRSGPDRDSLVSVAVTRKETRTVNQRDEDRHRLAQEEVAIRHRNKLCKAQLVNLSSGGAMIEAPIAPNLWDRVDLLFDKSTRIEAAVRWIRDGRIGLEFAHETGLDCASAVRDQILRKVVERNFPDLAAEDEEEQAVAADDERSGADQQPREYRHPLVFSGEVHFDHDSSPVRLRNVSATGALIEAVRSFPVGAEILLDLGEAGSLFATVSWARGDRCGLAFRESFDVARLAMARPELTRSQPGEVKPVRGVPAGDSPWAEPWQRLSVDALRRKLG